MTFVRQCIVVATIFALTVMTVASTEFVDKDFAAIALRMQSVSTSCPCEARAVQYVLEAAHAVVSKEVEDTAAKTGSVGCLQCTHLKDADSIEDIVGKLTTTVDTWEKVLLLDRSHDLISTEKATLSSETKTALVSSLKDLLAESIRGKAFRVVADKSPLVAAAKLAGLTFHFAGQKELTLSARLLHSWAKLASANRFVSSPHDARALVRLATLLGDNEVYVPLQAEVANEKVFVAGKSGTLKIRVGNVFGDAQDGVNATLVSVEPSLLSDKVQLQPSSSGFYEWQVPETALPGLYVAKLQTTSPKSKRRLHILRFKVTGYSAFSSASLFVSKKVSGSDVSGEDKLQVDYPSLASGTLKLTRKKSYLQASFELTGSIEPHHVSFVLTREDTKESAVFFAQQNDKTYKLSIATMSEEFMSGVPGNGDYTIETIIDDAMLMVPVRWKVARLTVNLEKAPSLVSHFDQFHEIKEEIHHEFGGNEVRPHFVAYVFTALIAMTFVLLIVAWAKLGLNIDTTSLGEFPSAAFQAIILALLLVFLTYWRRLNLFQAMKLLAGLGSVAMLVGRRALQRHAMTMSKLKKD